MMYLQEVKLKNSSSKEIAASARNYFAYRGFVVDFDLAKAATVVAG